MTIDRDAGRMTPAQLQAEVERLTQLVCDFQAAALIDVGNQGGPCRVEPRHVEAEMTKIRDEVERLRSTPVFRVDPDGSVRFRYRNHRGEVSVRHVEHFIRLYEGITDYHRTKQWLLDAFDIDKRARRTFALRDILAPE